MGLPHFSELRNLRGCYFDGSHSQRVNERTHEPPVHCESLVRELRSYATVLRVPAPSQCEGPEGIASHHRRAGVAGRALLHPIMSEPADAIGKSDWAAFKPPPPPPTHTHRTPSRLSSMLYFEERHGPHSLTADSPILSAEGEGGGYNCTRPLCAASPFLSLCRPSALSRRVSPTALALCAPPFSPDLWL